jgi:hypothetical protein
MAQSNAVLGGEASCGPEGVREEKIKVNHKAQGPETVQSWEGKHGLQLNRAWGSISEASVRRREEPGLLPIHGNQ